MLFLLITLTSKATPVTTGEATLVPLRERQPEWRTDPNTIGNYVWFNTYPYQPKMNNKSCDYNVTTVVNHVTTMQQN